jgi:hypothetical protein
MNDKPAYRLFARLRDMLINEFGMRLFLVGDAQRLTLRVRTAADGSNRPAVAT